LKLEATVKKTKSYY